MVSLAQLCEHLGYDLYPVSARPAAHRNLSGVHISELDDPTPYLEGGELLLTTGIPVSGSEESVRQYVRRLAERKVAALGLGLGAGLDEVPPALGGACLEAGMELLVVPDGTPFMRVSRRYWDLVAETGQADLAASLGTQTSLARAATRPEARASLLRELAQALGGWAVYLPADGSAETLWPVTAKGVVPQLREETARLNMAGAYSAATFPLHGTDVVEYPILVGPRLAGFLAIGAGRALRKTDRQLIITVSMLLSLKAQQEQELEGAAAVLNAAVTQLILNGHPDAARMMAAEFDIPLDEQVRLLAVRGLDLGKLTASDLADVVLGLAARDLPGGLRQSILRSRLRYSANGLSYIILDGEMPVSTHPDSSGAPLSDAKTTGSAERSRGCAAALSEPMLLNRVATVVGETSGACARAAAGHLVPVVGALDPQARAWADALGAYERADLVDTVRSYLRHRGQWEVAARELKLHRNSLRHRISIASKLIGADLNDPDVAANLWLALRNHA